MADTFLDKTVGSLVSLCDGELSKKSLPSFDEIAAIVDIFWTKVVGGFDSVTESLPSSLSDAVDLFVGDNTLLDRFFELFNGDGENILDDRQLGVFTRLKSALGAINE